MKLRIVILLLLMLSVIATAGILFTLADSPRSPQPSSQKIKDMVGRDVVIPVPVNRAIILNSYWNEIVSTLGVSDKVVGIDRYTLSSFYVPKSVKQCPVVGDLFSGVNIETIIALKPDVVIMDFGYGKTGDIIKSLESMGIPVVCMYSNNFEDQINAIKLLGKVFEVKARADSLINFLEIRHSMIISTTSLIPDRERPTVILCRLEKDGLITTYANSTWGKIVEDVGGINIALREFPGQSWPKINLEKLLAWDPDIIIIVGYDKPTLSFQLSSIMNNSVWSNLKAVKASNVYPLLIGSKVEGAYLDWGPRMLLGEMLMAKLIQPKYFGTLDTDRIAELLFSTYYTG